MVGQLWCSLADYQPQKLNLLLIIFGRQLFIYSVMIPTPNHTLCHLVTGCTRLSLWCLLCTDSGVATPGHTRARARVRPACSLRLGLIDSWTLMMKRRQLTLFEYCNKRRKQEDQSVQSSSNVNLFIIILVNHEILLPMPYSHLVAHWYLEVITVIFIYIHQIVHGNWFMVHVMHGVPWSSQKSGYATVYRRPQEQQNWN